MTREAFTIDRQLEFFSESELTKQLGHPRERWLRVLVAELFDNALDHLDEISGDKAPEFHPKVSLDYRDNFLIVEDNGDGIPPEVVRKMRDFQSRTSSRVAYVTPTRGAQGNAYKCVFALPFVLNGSSGIVEIDAQGVIHTIEATVDPLDGQPNITHFESDRGRTSGTRVSVQIDADAFNSDKKCLEVLVSKYATINPHVTFEFEGKCYERTKDTHGRIPPREDPSAWHSPTTFSALISHCVRADQATGKIRTVREFLMRKFLGLKRSETIKKVLEETGLGRVDLSALADSSTVERLLRSMQANTTEPKADKLGTIGKAHLLKMLGGQGLYKLKDGVTEDGLPFRMEAAFLDRGDDQGSRLVTGVNFSVDVDRPSFSVIDTCMTDCLIDEDASVTLVVHVSMPRPNYTNRGKTEIVPCRALSLSITEMITSITKHFTKQMKLLERDVVKAYRLSRRQDRDSNLDLKDAILLELDEGIRICSSNGTCEFSARNLYYALRPLIQQHTSAELKYDYLNSVIDQFELEQGIIAGRTRDPRGFLFEPHSGAKIPLGTQDIESYQIPLDTYQCVIFCEKKGMIPTFEHGKIGQRFDALIVASEGFAVRAAQTLMQRAANGHEMKVFVFHDCDPAGFSICHAIGKPSGAHRFDFDVIDAGISGTEAIEMKLQTELFPRSKELSKKVPMDKNARQMFTGKLHEEEGANGVKRKKWLDCRRVELNALAAEPDRFVSWVESKLKAHGITEKLTPSRQTSAIQAQRFYSAERSAFIQEELIRALGLERLCTAVDAELTVPSFDGTHADLKQWAQELGANSWRDRVREIAHQKLNDDSSQIIAAVNKVLKSN